jgi:phosphoglycerate dehydrogenase-like enzyme
MMTSHCREHAMSKFDVGFRQTAVGVRSPIIVNQLGPDVRAALVDHWSQPWMIDHPIDRAPWDIPKDADILLTRPLVGWDKAPVSKSDGWPFGLRWIQSASTGLDFFPSWMIEGATVTVGRGISAVPIAEYVIAAILAFEKRFDAVRPRGPKDWKPTSLGLLSGKAVGIAGFCAIGRAVAARASAFGVSIKVLRRSSGSTVDPGIDVVDSIEKLVESADHLVIALPLTTKTVNLIDAVVLAKAKPSLHLVNVARGKIVDQAALLRALDAGRLAGATLDVTDPEPPAADDPIYRHPKIVLTPHISWTGGDSLKAIAEKTVTNLDAYARGEPLADVFDRNLEY